MIAVKVDNSFSTSFKEIEYKMDLKKQLYKLTEIGIALSTERDLDKLLEKILLEARNFTHAEAGTLYIREGDKLLFAVTQNDWMNRKNQDNKEETSLKGSYLPISKSSIAGYVAATGEILNIPDAYEIGEEEEYSFNKDYDLKEGYRTKSMLIVPLKEPSGNILGVLQLINAKDTDGLVIPFDPAIEPLVQSLASQAAVALKNAQLTQEIKTAYLDTIYRLSIAAEYKDTDTGFHVKRMSHYSAIIAEELGFSEDEVENILYASPMHDIGKIGVPDRILQKPGKLTPEEFEEMKKHTLIGAEILSHSDSDILQLSEKIALSHHEKYDGSGYPYGVSGESIPMEARIVAVADVFDALTSKRCYKPAFSVEKAVSIIQESSGSHFDPKVVEAFLKGLPKILTVKNKYSDQELEKEKA
ncbi:MAG: HD domain-containing protein [Planctomycetota bacterium]|nr:MAG: HD domain-containing protein [Planctomycetota bacterium]